ncbi:DUF1542 domain-containing protein [Streptococcus mitis]|uniref:Gram-positive cocci surface proteins LPxTG domain-containing protein n=1 Tax=Streptococcus mitis TaxID=28037 RepID=A0A1X1KBP3_STRMT|nr:DUF1542 domain-containing protein [Streptococcus mitis]ORO96788.1 hypothetical protein B7700_00495 [Streptococcus mitis]
MGNKPSMSRSERLRREKVTRYSIRKYSFGAASVAVAALFMFLGNGAVSVQADEIQEPKTADVPTKEVVLDKTQLKSYIAEIEEKISAGKYANKTEESIALLNSELASAKSVLASATSQDELKAAYNKFVTVVSSKLQNKPVEKKETPVVDTTNGKETVGKKAENTEKKSDSNSIENTGSNDSRNGKALDRDNAFRTEAVTNKKPVGNIPFSNATAKDIYVYKGEETNIELSATDDSGKLKDIRIAEGSRGIDAAGAAGGRINNQYGLTFSSQRNETEGIVATQDNPAKVTITGTVSVPNRPTYTGKLVTRYLVAEDLDGAVFSEPSGNQENANPLPEGYFKLWVREQTQKYDIQVQTNEAGKIAVADVNNLSQADFEKIKNNIKITYNTADDARLLDKNGKLVENASNYIDTVTKQADQIVVTYKDGSRDSVALTSVLRNNPIPTVKVPYSNQAEKQVYVYKGENTDLTFTANDDTTVKDMYLRGPGDVNWNNTEAFGFTTGKIDNGVVTGKGTISDNKQEATITMTGETNLDAGKQWTSYVVANDNDNFSSMPADRNFNALDIDPDAKSKPGYIRFVVKDQTSKYDIKDLTDSTRITVNDIDNITATDLATIKSRLKLEYSSTNDDERLASLKGTAVTNPTSLIDTVAVSTTDPSKLVVTYKDGSVDTIEKSKVLNVRPKGIIPFSNPATKEIYVYKGEETNIELSATDDSGKIKDIRIAEGGRGNDAPGAAGGRIRDQYGLTTGYQRNETGIEATETNPAKVTITGTVSVSGQPNFKGNLMTRYLVAEDLEGATFSDPNGNSDSGKTVDQVPEGWFKLVVREQTQKYDIQGQTEEANKIAVSDINNLSNDDFEKIKNNIKIQYNTADDERLKDKNGSLVENASQYIKSITKEGDKIVVTYKDGSTDKLTLTEVVKLDKQPAIDAVNTAATEKIAAINSTPNATDEEKAAAIAKVNADKEKALTAINDANVTTKAELDKAKEAGTTAIAGDNPVVAKKAAAKADVEAARQAKADAINADKNLTQAEKDAALAKVNKAAEDATKAIDAATTDAAVDTAKGTGVTEIGKVNPVAKQNAKDAIGNALTAKNQEIDDRKDLTQAEKDAAKAEAKKLADAELTKVNAQPDNAETAEAAAAAQKLVNDAEDKGVADVTSVYPIAKEEAKKAVADELAKKEKELDDRKDLTTEEKAAAKKEAKDLAKKATDAINAQPAIADTSDKATAAQQAVDTAKTTGVAEVKAVNPEAVKKNVAKKAIEDALTAKNNAIDARDDLTPEQKTAAKEAAKAKADAAKDAIDKATTDADVDQAKTDGETAVANVTPVAKKPAKQAIAKALEDKNAEIDKRTDLTEEEKATAKKEAKDKADAQLAEIAKQPDVADTPEAAQTAQTAVDAAKKTGVDEVTAVNPTAVTKPEAKKAIDAKLAEQLKTIESTPDATDDEKKVAADAAKALAAKAKAEIDKAGTDADVKALEDEAKAEIEKSLPLVEDKPNARKAIDEEATAKKAAIDSRTDLTPKAKEDLKAQVDKIAEQAKKSVDAAKTAEAVDGIEESDKAAIKAVGEVNIPADKVLVNDPSTLTDDEKAKVLEAVKKVNPDAKEITQDADGNITVTTPDGHQETITPEQVVKTSDTANEPKAGNDVVKPANKVVVADPAKLTDAEKEKIKAAVEAVNPNSVVTVDEKGNAKVSTPDGQTQVIPVDELVRTAEDTKKPNAGNDINTPSDKTVVANPEALTPEEKKAIEDKVKAVNPGATVVVDDKGNATVTTPSGKTAVIPAADLTKTAEAASKPNAGDDVVKPASKTVVANPEALTPEEKKAIEDKVKAVNPGATVVVDDKGNATVTTPSGKTAVIPAADLTKTAEAASKPNAGDDVVKPASKTVVANPEALTPEEKKAIEDKVKAVNPGATVVVDDKGNATVTTPSGKTAVIPAADLTKTAEAASKPNAGNDINTPAVKTAVAKKDALTDSEKEAVKTAVEAVNPGAKVVVDDKGNATVTTKDGKTAVIPASQLVIPTEKLADLSEQNGVNIPATRTLVADKNNLTPEEIAKIKVAVEAVNPGSTVVVDEKGNATVTTVDGKTATISAEQLVKDEADVATKNNGENLNLDFEKQLVADLDNLTDADKAGAKAKIMAANPDVAEVIFDDKGNATVILNNGKAYTVLAKDIFKEIPYVPSYNRGNNRINNAETIVDKSKLEGAIRQLDKLIIQESAKLDAETVKEANALLAAAKEVFANANATQAEVDAMVKRIEDFMLKVSPATNHAILANDQATQATNANQETANVNTVAKELPNTGTEANASLAALGLLGALGGFGLLSRKKKED